MYPTLFSIGPLRFHSYTVFIALACLVGVTLGVRENMRREEPLKATTVIGVFLLLGGLIGARAYWILQYEDGWDKLTKLPTAIYLWGGGLVYFGGLIGGLLGGLLYLRINKIPILPALDIAAPYLALAHSIGRCACLLNGCCYGRLTDLPWGVHYPAPSSDAYLQHLKADLISNEALHSLACHPTPIYSSIGLVTIFFILRAYYRRPHPTGSVFLLYFVLYGFDRFIIECFRGDVPRHAEWFNMTTSQIIAITTGCLALLLFATLRKTLWRNTTATEPATESGDE